MANCFLCGRKIPLDVWQTRRKVKTGEWVRKRYQSPRINTIQAHYGMRIVCPLCARFLDRQRIVDELKKHVVVLLLLVSLFTIVMSQFRK